MSANAKAEIEYEDGLKAVAEAKASVATAEASVSADYDVFKVKFTANVDVISAGAEAKCVIGKNEDGDIEITLGAGIGALLFGCGGEITIILG